MLNLEELDRQYQEASLGTARPSILYLRCEECGVTYMLPREIEWQLCDHLMKLLLARMQEEPADV